MNQADIDQAGKLVGALLRNAFAGELDKLRQDPAPVNVDFQPVFEISDQQIESISRAISQPELLEAIRKVADTINEMEVVLDTETLVEAIREKSGVDLTEVVKHLSSIAKSVGQLPDLRESLGAIEAAIKHNTEELSEMKRALLRTRKVRYDDKGRVIAVGVNA